MQLVQEYTTFFSELEVNSGPTKINYSCCNNRRITSYHNLELLKVPKYFNEYNRNPTLKAIKRKSIQKQ